MHETALAWSAPIPKRLTCRFMAGGDRKDILEIAIPAAACMTLKPAAF
jgi:hypothetical protein